VPDLAEPGDPGSLTPARHDDPEAGPVSGWSAKDMPDDLLVGDDDTEDDHVFPLAADGTQAD
jgi:hypothetical protein